MYLEKNAEMKTQDYNSNISFKFIKVFAQAGKQQLKK